MRPTARRFAPVLLWQLGSLLLWLGALAIAPRLSFEGPFRESLLAMLGLILLIGAPAFLQEASLGLLRRAWNGRPPAIAADFGRLTGFLLLAIPAPAASAMATAVREGFLFAASVFTVVFAAFAVGTWTAWARGYLRPKNSEKPRDLSRGVEAGGLRFIAEANDDGIGELGFRVVADSSVTMRSVVTAFTGAQLLPGLSGGKRTWSVSIDERPVAVATQTWEHPRWWPPIEWSAGPDEAFPVGGVLRLRVASGTAA